MKLKEAVRYGIFAINTWMHPDASSAEDIQSLEDNEEEARHLLLRLADDLSRDVVVEVERDQVEALLRHGEIGTTSVTSDETLQQYIRIRVVPTREEPKPVIVITTMEPDDADNLGVSWRIEAEVGTAQQGYEVEARRHYGDADQNETLIEPEPPEALRQAIEDEIDGKLAFVFAAEDRARDEALDNIIGGSATEILL